MKTQDCWLERFLLAFSRKEKSTSSRIPQKATWPKGSRLGAQPPGFRFQFCPELLCDLKGALHL